VLSYLRKHPADQEDGWFARAEVADALILVLARYWEHRRQELHWLRAGIRLGLPRRLLSEPLGLGTHLRSEDGNPSSALPERLQSLSDVLEYDDAGADLSRSNRRSQALEPGDPRAVWLHSRRREIADAIGNMLTCAAQFGADEDPWVAELAGDLRDDHLSSGTFAVWGLVTAGIRSSRSVAALRTTRNVHRWLRTADLLRSEFSNVGCRATWIHTPPPAENLSEALELVFRRREKTGDPALELVPAADQPDPDEMLDFLRLHNAGRERWIRQAEVPTALKLHVAQWWADRRDELLWLERGRRGGVFLTQLGAPFGIRSRQGTQDRIDRLQALLTRGKPDQAISRAQRQATAAATGLQEVRESWIERHQREIYAVIGSLIAAARAAEVPDESRESLDDVAGDHRHGTVTTSTLTILRWAAGEVREASDDPELLRAAGAAERLCRDYKSAIPRAVG
jgi:hypothetical protein